MPKSITELLDQKTQLRKKGQDLVDKAKAEKRTLTADENTQFTETRNQLLDLDLQIDEANSLKVRSGVEVPHEARGKFSFVRAIRNAVDQKAQSPVDAAVIAEGAALQRSCGNTVEGISIPLESRAAMTATIESPNLTVIDENKLEMLLPLQAALVTSQAGCRMLSGLIGNIAFPAYTGNNVKWEGENVAAEDGAGTFSKKSFTPKRLTAYVDISKQLLVQENMSIETLVRDQLVLAISQKVESTLFGKAAHADTQPDGLFTGYAPTVGNTLSWASIVAQETAVDMQNALTGNIAYIMHPALFGKSKTLVKDASGAGGFIFGSDGSGMLNGYKALRTTNMASAVGKDSDEFGCVFGNWADLFIGQWGALDLVVDPYTQAKEGMLRIVINSYFNFGKVRGASFAVGSFK